MVKNYDDDNNSKNKNNATASTTLLNKYKYIENKNAFVSYLYNFASIEIAFHVLGVGISSIISAILLVIHWIMGNSHEESRCSSISMALKLQPLAWCQECTLQILRF